MPALRLLGISIEMFDNLPAVFHVHGLVHPDRNLDLELLVLGALRHVRLVPLGHLGGDGGGPDHHLAQLLVVQVAHNAGVLSVKLHLKRECFTMS